MEGLFEDDSNVRHTPKKKEKDPKKEKDVASRIVKKAESKASVVNIGGVKGGVDFSNVDDRFMKKAKEKKEKEKKDDSIVPPINYISDEE